MKYEISPNRHLLTFTVDAAEQAELRELAEEKPDDFRSDMTMSDWFERITCNSELDWIPEGVTGDLTDAPMLGITGSDMTEQQIKVAKIEHYGLRHYGCWDGIPRFQPVLERWAYEPYQLRSPLQDLRDTGKCVFVDGF